MLAGEDAATDLPLDRPPPVIQWPESVFVFTGKFAFGPRRDCERQVQNLGGVCEPNITQRTNYVVIGTFGSRDWVHTAFGRKIEKALGYRESGIQLAILAEDHWAGSLP
jgi:NAD-dependent DNA ligase